MNPVARATRPPERTRPGAPAPLGADLRALALDSMLEPLAILRSVRDTRYRIVDFEWTYINEAGAESILLPLDGLVGSRLLERLPEHRNGLFDTYVRVVETGEPFLAHELGYDDTWGTDEVMTRVMNIRAIRVGDGFAVSWNDVTEQVRVRHELEKAVALEVLERDARRLADSKYREISRQSPIGLALVDRDGQFTEVNPALCAMTGYSEAELLKLTFHELTHPDDHTLDAAQAEQMARGLVPNHVVDRRYLRADGEVAWVRVHASSVCDAAGNFVTYVAQIIDITEQRRANAALVDSERLYRLIADNVSDMVLRIEQGRWTWLSPSVGTRLGHAIPDVVDREIALLVHPDDLHHFTSEASGTELLRARFRTTADEWVWTECHAGTFRDDDGRPAGLLVIARDISAQVVAEESARNALADLSYRSSHDLLTGLKNRAEVIEHLDATLSRRRSGERLALLFIDVDHFKDINDGISHAAGDLVLTGIAERISASLRPTDVVGRLGGDEFAAVLGGVRSAHEATRAAERVREAVSSAPFHVAGRQVSVSISIGIGVAGRGIDAATLLSEADAALYRAKSNGRNRWELADGAMRAAASLRLSQAARIRAGLDAAQFHPWFQPLVDLATGDLIGYEALARWVTPDGVQDASEFLGAAEEAGLAHTLGRAVTQSAIRALPALPDPMTMAINLSPGELGVRGLASELLSLLADVGTDPARLVIEVTEQELMSLDPSSRAGLSRLRTAGVGVHVDDFGTGYASLTTLRDYPVSGINWTAVSPSACSAHEATGPGTWSPACATSPRHWAWSVWQRAWRTRSRPTCSCRSAGRWDRATFSGGPARCPLPGTDHPL